MRTVEVVEIDLKVYNDLIADQQMLLALESAGVDNWSGYDFAIELLQQMNSEDA